MKHILTLTITLFALTAFGQKYSDMITTKMTSDEWDKQAETNKRLLPRYGHLPKTDEEKKADQEFMKTVLEKDSTNRKASDHLIRIGFSYLYRDIKTAMYRFNQAYLLDSTNTDIYWGFGGVYMTLGNYAKAEKEYLEGLAVNPKNTHLLTDYATYFMAQYSILLPIEPKDTLDNLGSAITYLNKSYQLDPKDQNTTFKLSICYWNKGDCDKAWKYYDICKVLGGQPITEDYINDLKKKCKQKK